MRREALLLAVLAFLFFHGCAGRRPVPPAAAPPGPPVPSEVPSPSAPSAPVEPSPPAPEPPAPAPPVVVPGDRAHAAGVSAMAEGQHERALELFTASWKENPGNPGVARDFPEALEGLKRAGDDAFAKGRLEEAGKRWEAAQRHLGHAAAKGKAISFTRADLQKSIDRLSATLMEKGLLEYRKGNLDAAIAHWRTILAYDPSHAEATRSVQTATTQLENLKKIAPPPK